MAAGVCAFILTLFALRGSAAGSGLLSAPTNVRLTSRNMDLVLRWEPPEGAPGDLKYTAEYRSSATRYRAGCTNISALHCDLTSTFISVFGNYTGRVRAHRGAESSGWVQSNHVTLDRDSSIGPPNVTLDPTGTSLEVSITDPVFKTSSLRVVYPFASYNIIYWNSSQKEEAKTLSDVQQNRVVLDDLEPMSEYCVQVQINTRNTRLGDFSDIVCASTADKDAVPWVAAVVTVVVTVMLVVLVVVMVVYWNRISQFLCPEIVLPPHFKESLLPPPKSSVYLASPPSEEVCDRVCIIADNRTKVEAEERPLEERRSSKWPDAAQEES